MNRHIIKGYLKHCALWSMAFIFAFVLLAHYSDKAKQDWYVFAVIFLIGIVENYSQFKKKALFLADLKEKGISEEEFDNAAFIKNWEEKRNKGLLKFTLIDGGIILGVAFLLIIAFAGILITITFSMPIELGSLIGYSYLVGALLGMSANLFLWSVNQKKFARLTNPLH